MARSGYTIDEVRFDLRDMTATHVYCYVSGKGDSPHFVQGWHHSTYPVDMSLQQIHARLAAGLEEDRPVQWERLSPPEVQTSEAGELARAILSWDIGMDPMKPGWAYYESLRMMAESVVGERNKITKW